MRQERLERFRKPDEGRSRELQWIRHPSKPGRGRRGDGGRLAYRCQLGPPYPTGGLGGSEEPNGSGRRVGARPFFFATYASIASAAAVPAAIAYTTDFPPEAKTPSTSVIQPSLAPWGQGWADRERLS